MAKALIKVIYRALIGATSNELVFEFQSKLELKQFLKEYVSENGTAPAIALKKVTYKWNYETSKFEAVVADLAEGDL